ncbi:hypothetical protein QJS10_CPB14g00344 [Acorus calamus]|uniref:CRM domain-containing protein n=1 Tax=Acorus calamus TaxID=4465 RepID=A0AAV9DAR8_ACOCL|nr:hypothetical protein QJS10_CPB14g00344 [Acorus calamus]
MALSPAKISELHFLPKPLPLCSRPTLNLRRHFKLFFSSSSSPPIRVSERNRDSNRNPSSRRYPWDDDEDVPEEPPRNPRTTAPNRGRVPPKPRPPSAPWLGRWEPAVKRRSPLPLPVEPVRGRGGSIERIVHRLRNLGLEDEEGVEGEGQGGLEGDERLGDLLGRKWARPDQGLLEEDRTVLPWEREDNGGVYEGAGGEVGKKRVAARAPSLAELTIEDEELRRLRRQGIALRERITVPKAGVTGAIAEKIHDAWRKSELVRLKFHEALAHDMKIAHELVERRTGGLVIWRSGSVMVVYRGSAYKRPSSGTQSLREVSSPTKILHEGDAIFVPDVSSPEDSVGDGGSSDSPVMTEKAKLSIQSSEHIESLTEEEIEYNKLLDGLGPRFVDWWGTGILPVDADLLPQNLPGYMTPFRLLPHGMRPRLTNAEMTNLRKLARSLPCHFALGRNRNHHGLAAAILELWEQSLVVKIAVKRGIQNTNNKLMAEELKVSLTITCNCLSELTGGTLLLRNKFYIVIYRGKDFVPKAVAEALAERQKLTKDIQHSEEKARNRVVVEAQMDKTEEHAPAGTLAEFHEAQARWGRKISPEEYEEMKETICRSKTARVVKRIEHKQAIAQAKLSRAEKLLSKIEASMVPSGPSDDQETITDEERSVFRRIGLKMKAYLPLGEALSQHIAELERTLDQMKSELDDPMDDEDESSSYSEDHVQSDHVPRLSQFSGGPFLGYHHVTNKEQ